MNNATFTGILGKRELISYVDPCPGKKGSDLTAGECGRCGGTGYTSFVWVMGGVCFQCGGNGAKNITVATKRRHAREAAYARDYAAEIAAHRNAVAEAAAALAREEAAKAEAAAQAAEQARLAALVQGFVGEVGEKVTGLAITVKVAKYRAGSYNRSSSMFVVAETATGQVVMFSGSARSVMALQRGDEVTILTAKVRDHDSYMGQDQTVLSHVKVTEVEREEEVA